MRLKYYFQFVLFTIHSVWAVVRLSEPLQSLLDVQIKNFQRKANGYNQKDTQFNISPSYDFIVIGSGPGGSTVANRLTENERWRVLLLEAGEEESIYSTVPGLTPVTSFTDYNWNFETEPEANACLAFKERKCTWPRGKALGGTSTINYMLYFRGHKLDYDDWCGQGNIGWCYDDILPYFIKSENARDAELTEKSYHGVGGELSVQHGEFKTKSLYGFLNAAEEMGYPYGDYNDGSVGQLYSESQFMIDGNIRASAARAFLKPAKDRANLDIVTKVLVLKILIDPTTNTAYGVTAYSLLTGDTFDIFATKEVVLSAGTLQSPQLLMLSGVGPNDHLEEMGIEVLQDSPGVGQNLKDHVALTTLVISVNQTGVALTLDPKFVREYIKTGEGPLSVPLAGGAYTFIQTKYHYPKSDPRPDIEILYAGGSIVSDKTQLVSLSYGLSEEMYNQVFKPLEGPESFSMYPTLYHPKSTGYMQLRSNDPFVPPKFYANYYEIEEDLDKMVEGVKFAIEMTNTNALQKYGSQINYLEVEACMDFEMGSDEYWKCIVMQFTTSLHHQGGTCKMGPPEDDFAVVSPELKVYGINRLRIVDASIMPTLPCAHITAPTYMIAEKASDDIKRAWGFIN